MDPGHEFEDEPMSTEMLDDIHDGSKSHPNVNRRKACYNMRGCNKQRKMKLKAALLYTQNMGKGLHKLFKAFVKILSKITNFG